MSIAVPVPADKSPVGAGAAEPTPESSAGIAGGSAEAVAVPVIAPVLAGIVLARAIPIGVAESMKAIGRRDFARLGGRTMQEERRCQGRGDAHPLNAGKLDTHRRHPFHARRSPAR